MRIECVKPFFYVLFFLKTPTKITLFKEHIIRKPGSRLVSKGEPPAKPCHALQAQRVTQEHSKWGKNQEKQRMFNIQNLSTADNLLELICNKAWH